VLLIGARAEWISSNLAEHQTARNTGGIALNSNLEEKSSEQLIVILMSTGTEGVD
jgi:hypothetical protein